MNYEQAMNKAEEHFKSAENWRGRSSDNARLHLDFAEAYMKMARLIMEKESKPVWSTS